MTNHKEHLLTETILVLAENIRELKEESYALAADNSRYFDTLYEISILFSREGTNLEDDGLDAKKILEKFFDEDLSP